MNNQCKRRLDRIDRQHYWGKPFQGTWLDLEIEAQSPKLIIMRMVRRGRLITGEAVQCLADFCFVMTRGQLCGVAEADALEADGPRYQRPYMNTEDNRILSRRPSIDMLVKLAARSSVIKVLGGGYFYEFRGLTHHGRLIRCEQQEDAYAHGF